MVLVHTVLIGQTEYNFNEITVQHGLNDGHIQSIAQDKHGNMWFGSLGGLNRYNGQSIKKFYHSSTNPNSILSGLAITMSLLSNGRFFIGFENGLMEYNYSNSTFRQIIAFKGENIENIINYKNKLYLTSNKQFYEYDTETDKRMLINFNNVSVKNKGINKLFLYKKNVYIATTQGVYRYNIESKKIFKVDFGIKFDTEIFNIFIDKAGYYWVNKRGNEHVFKISTDKKQVVNLDKHFPNPLKNDRIRIDFLANDTLKTWILTRNIGILEYDLKSNNILIHKPNKNEIKTINSRFFFSGFCDQEGGIWIGSKYGVTYFNTKIKQFKNLTFPFVDIENPKRILAQNATEDSYGNLWLGYQDGLAKYNIKNKSYKLFQNIGEKKILYTNKIRELYIKDNYLWIITSRGINRLNLSNDKIEFITGFEEKLNLAFTSFFIDSENTQWYGCVYGDGLYFIKNNGSGKFQSVKEHPYLSKFGKFFICKMFMDSKNRLWFGTYDKGLYMFDPKTKDIKVFDESNKKNNSLAGNSVFDINEDKIGIIWVTTNQGLTGINLINNTTQNFTIQNGLNSPSVFSLAIDKKNRIWIGASKELLMLDEDRKRFSSYGVANGLPCSEFTEHSGFLSSNNTILLGTQCGFILFDPLELGNEPKPIRCIINEFKIANKQIVNYDINEVKQVKLKPFENTIEIEFAGLNYSNPQNVVYAYFLEGIEKEWTYSTTRVAKYLNLPSGTYYLKYKAKDINGIWQNNENVIKIQIATIFYKSWWFKSIITFLIVFLFYLLYRYRRHQELKILELNSRAQNLEREKSVVQYENLKQQLNPHFLFNSLASLNSLVTNNPKMAKQFVDYMSKIYRYLLQVSDNETVLLSQEIDFATTYVKVQQTRFAEGFEVIINVGSEDMHRRIVPVTLQNMIENAMKHNIIDAELPLVIEIYIDEEYVVVKNNLQKKSMVETSNNRGLNQMKALYSYLSDIPIEIEENEKYFLIKIPLL